MAGGIFSTLVHLSSSGAGTDGIGFDHPSASPHDVFSSQRLVNAIKAVVLHSFVTSVIMYFVLVKVGLPPPPSTSSLEYDPYSSSSSSPPSSRSAGLAALLPSDPENDAPSPPPPSRLPLPVLALTTSLCLLSSLVIWSGAITRDLRLASLASSRDPSALSLHVGREEATFRRGLLSSLLASVAFFKALVLLDSGAMDTPAETAVSALLAASLCAVPIGTFAGFGQVDSYENWCRALLGVEGEGANPLTFVEIVSGNSFWAVVLSAAVSALFKPLDGNDRFCAWPAPLFLSGACGLVGGAAFGSARAYAEWRLRLRDVEIRKLLGDADSWADGECPLTEMQLKHMMERYTGWFWLALTGGVKRDQIDLLRKLLSSVKLMQQKGEVMAPRLIDATVRKTYNHCMKKNAAALAPSLGSATLDDVNHMAGLLLKQQDGKEQKVNEIVSALEKRRDKRTKK